MAYCGALRAILAGLTKSLIMQIEGQRGRRVMAQTTDVRGLHNIGDQLDPYERAMIYVSFF